MDQRIIDKFSLVPVGYDGTDFEKNILTYKIPHIDGVFFKDSDNSSVEIIHINKIHGLKTRYSKIWTIEALIELSFEGMINEI